MASFPDIHPATEESFKYLLQVTAILMSDAETLNVPEEAVELHLRVDSTIAAILDPSTDTLSAAESVVGSLWAAQACRWTIYLACTKKHGVGGLLMLARHCFSIHTLRQIYWKTLPRRVSNACVRQVIRWRYSMEAVREIAQKMRWDAIKVHDPIKSAQLNLEASRLISALK